MLKFISIKNFRGFSDFKLNKVGRVNLLVGNNNSGKTSALEAIQMLASAGNYHTMFNCLHRRGERVWYETDRRIAVEADIKHLFKGHDIFAAASFEIAASNDAPRFLKVTLVDGDDDADESQELFESDDDSGVTPYRLKIEWANNSESREEYLSLSPRNGISLDRRPRMRQDPNNIRFISTSSMDIDEVISLFENIVLTPEEDEVVKALQTIEPSIERIATLATSPNRFYGNSDRGGIVVRCKGIDNRIPIGSMGDGIWRMLGLALALIRAENGVLLIDEIDTGLHHTVMNDMWRLVNTTAERLGAQVFATTHSRDCYESLASVINENSDRECDVTIHRIERDSNASVIYTPNEISIAAKRGLEIR